MDEVDPRSEQRMLALARGDRMRVERGVLRKRIAAIRPAAASRAALADLLEEMPDAVRGVRVGALVTWARGSGSDWRDKMLPRLGIHSELRRVDELTDRQRVALIADLRRLPGDESAPSAFVEVDELRRIWESRRRSRDDRQLAMFAGMKPVRLRQIFGQERVLRSTFERLVTAMGGGPPDFGD